MREKGRKTKREMKAQERKTGEEDEKKEWKEWKENHTEKLYIQHLGKQQEQKSAKQIF